MHEYICYTKQGNWRFYAADHTDAMRLALYYCWRDGEDFKRIESLDLSARVTLRICAQTKDSLRTL